MSAFFIHPSSVHLLYRHVTLLIIVAIIQQVSSGILPSGSSLSLYNANDKVVILTSHNFSSTVYQAKTAWLIEFYASWCGHCQSYANVK